MLKFKYVQVCGQTRALDQNETFPGLDDISKIGTNKS